MKKMEDLKIEEITYQTCRNVTNLDDKLNISIIFIFSKGWSSELYAQMLYAPISEVIDIIREETKKYYDEPLEFHDLRNENLITGFEDTRKKLIKKDDADGYLKAIYEHDPYALVCLEIAEIFNHVSKEQVYNNVIKELNNVK